jgi:Carboxypeptidase regulatory-like domain
MPADGRRLMAIVRRFGWILVASVALWMYADAQTSGALKGLVTDSTGALIPGAEVTVTRETTVIKAVTADDGTYIVSGLLPGIYTVQATSQGMTQGQPVTVEISDAIVTLNLTLRLVLERQEITVQENAGPQLSVDPTQSAAAVVMTDSDLDALSDDPDDLQADLIALAGPSAGPNGGQIYIDGFTLGDSALPNKDAIREIRVNQNPFSPEFDAIGLGRTEIITKPGRDRFRGQAYFSYGNAVFNSRNPYAGEKPPFNLTDAGGSVGGPLNQNASFFTEIDQRNINSGAVISAVTLNPATLAIIDPFTQVYSSPQSRFRISPRIDYQFAKNHTLTFRYALTRSASQNNGVGAFNLPSQGYNGALTEHAFQVSESWVISPKVLDESRFQFLHQHNDQSATDHDPSIVVFNAFTGGGPSNPAYQYIHHHYEVQNNLSVLSGQHSWKFGVRLRAVSIVDTSAQNFDGTFTFGGAYAPILNAGFQPIVPGIICNPQVSNPGCETLSSIQQYQRTLAFQNMGLPIAQAQLWGGAPTQFSINTGTPVVDVGGVDVGLYGGDDWRIKPNLTLSLGLRYETQANIHDRHDFAPRFGLAWAPGNSANGGRPKTVIRSGFGIFYYRFSEQNTLVAQRYNGVNQQQYVIDNPSCYPDAPPSSCLSQGLGTPQAIHTVSSSLVAPSVLQSAIGIERQIPGNTTVSVNYTFSHGDHLLLSRNINAPLPGTYTGVEGTGVYPSPGQGPVYEMESGGLYNQSQLILNANSRLNSQISLFGFYVYGFVNSNTDGLGTFPANQYSLSGEYGPAATDVRHRATIGGSITAWWGLRFSPLITAQTGAPFDITTSQDIFGSTVLTARPAFATDPNKPGLIATSYGLLDPNPSPGETVLPRDYGRGPGLFTVDLRLARTWGLGERRGSKGNDAGGGAVAAPAAGPAMGRGPFGGFAGGPSPTAGASSGQRFSLTASVSARNMLNHVNPGPIIGSINSPLFGQSNQIAGGFGAFGGNASNRRLEFQLQLGF